MLLVVVVVAVAVMMVVLVLLVLLVLLVNITYNTKALETPHAAHTRSVIIEKNQIYRVHVAAVAVVVCTPQASK